MEHHRSDDCRDRAHASVLLSLLVAITLLLVLTTDPASGTGTNLQPVGDAASLVVGAHHAKPLPVTGAAVFALILLASFAAAVISVDRENASSVTCLAFRHDDDPLRRSLVTWSVRAMRAPPASLAA